MIARIVILIFLLLSFIHPEKGPDPSDINVKLAAYSWENPQEKAYIHTDKPFYVAGEDIWFKVYLMVGPYHIPDTLSSVINVELIGSDEKLVDRKLIRIREGLGFGDFTLPSGISPGEYIIKAYTQYMRNFDPAFFFRKSITVFPAVQELTPDAPPSTSHIKDTPDKPPVHLEFFPEGGDMVEGLQNYIAFKATNSKGKGIEIEGMIKNSEGEEITGFETKKFGMGLFRLNPAPGKNYYAELMYREKSYRFPLPASKKKGYVMHFNKVGDNLFIWVRNNMDLEMNGSFVVGQFRGFPFLTVNAKPGQKYLYSVISVKEIPSGIMHFTFFDSLGIPHCERLVYTENKNERINFTIDSDKETYKKRENADFYLTCTDLKGNPILTNISLSVTNTSYVTPEDSRSNILSYFNLESDLKGNIENPGYYFNPDNEDRFDLLDNLLLTHGWRRFTWEKILNEQTAANRFEPEIGFTIEGQLFNYYNHQKPQAGNVRAFIFENQFYYNEIESEDDGTFRLEGMNIVDSSQVVIQAWRFTDEKQKKKNKPPETRNDYHIEVSPRNYAGIAPEYWPDRFDVPDSAGNYLALNRNILKIDSSYDSRTIVMDELTIEDKKIREDPFYRERKLHKEPSSRVVMDSLSVTDQSLQVFDILRKYIPGLSIRGIPPDLNITLRGASRSGTENEPLILFDGNPVESDFIYYFPASEIAFVDVLNRAKATIYGGEAENGVIAIYSRNKPRSFLEEGRRGVHNFIHPGYYRAREFYTPDYDTKDDKHIKPDFRRTLYWNPTLTTNDVGDINFSFFTSDETGKYRMHIEGMTYSGIPFVRDFYFTVE